MSGVPRDRGIAPLSLAERRLDGVTAPPPADFSVHDPTPDPEHRVRAEYLARVIAQSLADGWTPFSRRGFRSPIIRLERAYVVGQLSLRAIELPHLLEFVECRFERPIDLRQANIGGLELVDCWLPGLRAKNLRSENDLVLTRSTVDGSSLETGVHDAVDLTDSDINGSLRLEYSNLRHPGHRALLADRMRARGGLVGTGIRVDGELRLAGMRLGGYLTLNGARLHNPGRDALNGNGIHVGGHLVANHATWGPATGEPFRAVGRIFLPSAEITGDMGFSGAQLSAGPLISDGAERVESELSDRHAALVADRIHVAGNLELDKGFRCTGTLRVTSARIEGTLRLAEAVVRAVDHDSCGNEPGHCHHPAEPRPRVTTQRAPGDVAEAWVLPAAAHAVRLDATQVRGDLDATRVELHGQLRLLNTAVQGSLLLTAAYLCHPWEDAVWAPRVAVGGELDGRELRVCGTLLFAGARIGVSLNLRGAVLHCPGRHEHSGWPKPSLDFRAGYLGRDVVCSSGFTASGGVRLANAQVGRDVRLHGATLGAVSGATALHCYGLRCQELSVPLAAPPGGPVVLSYASCASFQDNEALWANTIELEDFTYDTLHPRAELSAAVRLRWLGRAMPDYSPGPYDQLAATFRAGGHEDGATTVLIEKQRLRYAALARGSRLGPVVRLVSWLQRWMVGYGYRPTRALAWLVVCAVLGTVWFALHEPLVPVNEEDHPVWDPFLYTVDQLIPIVDLGNKSRWRADGLSKWITAAMISLGWILATTVAAGLTRLLKRNR
ncbi:oxidoreductase [Longimycelium tulufanense]|uniref:Oxidoreductase n=1 Tax=Longimycelium tulufanense TaxID=907463 RepID=A0A8J3C935_9PSEU|nr:oxidoreductase [Longimycelium tulufanense]GGM57745.1 oxidoreductase [Longimycelium tulufanense]